ncbi:MAG: alpha/beta hydrolase [Bacteroidetes bacterium]|nr:alpha/beta hydrolase [Bacteroidota bacterium]
MAKKIIALNKEFLIATSPDILEEIQMTIADTTSSIYFYANMWMKYFISYDPRPALEKTKIPVLAINGTTDLQVPYKENLGAIEKALQDAGNKNYKIVPLENLNHLFQTSNSGSPMEYATNAESFNENAMQVITEWILSLK